MANRGKPQPADAVGCNSEHLDGHPIVIDSLIDDKYKPFLEDDNFFILKSHLFNAIEYSCVVHKFGATWLSLIYFG